MTNFVRCNNSLATERFAVGLLGRELSDSTDKIKFRLMSGTLTQCQAIRNWQNTIEIKRKSFTQTNK